MSREPAKVRRVANGDDLGVYIISVAAELAGVHPQTLRIYERKGLLSPARTAGNTRRYSKRDIERLQTIQRLTQQHGINLAGVKMIVEMENELERMRRRMEVLDRDFRRARERMVAEIERLQRERATGAIVPVSMMRDVLSRLDQPGRAERKGRKRKPSGGGPIAAGPAATAG